MEHEYQIELRLSAKQFIDIMMAIDDRKGRAEERIETAERLGIDENKAYFGGIMSRCDALKQHIKQTQVIHWSEAL